MPIRIARVDVESGASTPFTTITVADPAVFVWLGASVARDATMCKRVRILGGALHHRWIEMKRRHAGKT